MGSLGRCSHVPALPSSCLPPPCTCGTFEKVTSSEEALSVMGHLEGRDSYGLTVIEFHELTPFYSRCGISVRELPVGYPRKHFLFEFLILAVLDHT